MTGRTTYLEVLSGRAGKVYILRHYIREELEGGFLEGLKSNNRTDPCVRRNLIPTSH